MRQKNNSSNNLVTKDFFKRGLKEELGMFEMRLDKKFATKEDLKGFATKEGLSILEMRVALKFDDFARRIDENAQKYRDQILNSNDKVVKELETMREENIVGSHQVLRLNKKVGNHGKRISKIEKAQQTA